MPEQQGGGMTGFISHNPLGRELIRIGNEAIATEDDGKLRGCFARHPLDDTRWMTPAG